VRPVRRLAAAALAAALLGLGLLPALAVRAVAAEVGAGWAHAVAREFMSPYCPGRTLADCPSPQAQTLRSWILVQEAAGRTREDVESELLERYGDQLLAAPRARGFGLTAYAVPIGVFLAGGALVAFFLRRQTRLARAEAPAAGAPLPPELERLVDEELGR
jgi:cytochrome c-type biogenesis protein CcmH/NrfF